MGLADLDTGRVFDTFEHGDTNRLVLYNIAWNLIKKITRGLELGILISNSYLKFTSFRHSLIALPILSIMTISSSGWKTAC